MRIPHGEKPSAPRMFVMVTRAEEEKKLEKIFESMQVPISYQCRGQGTASSEILDIFGFGGTNRLITVGFLPKVAARELFQKVGRQLAFHQKGGGIGITIPITGLQMPLFHLLNEESCIAVEKQSKERIGRDMAELQESSGYHVIWVSVAAGYSGEVFEAAKAAGAKGGTVLRGRRRNSQHASQHFGIPLQEEQEFVMIVVPREIKGRVMNAICRSCGLHTPVHGMVLSLPVDEVMGLEE